MPDTSNNINIKEKLFDNNLFINNLFYFIKQCDPSTRARLEKEVNNCIINYINENQIVLNNNNKFYINYTEYRQTIVRLSLQLLSVLVYKSKKLQSKLLDIELLLPSLLSHCVTDFKNPLAREWALLTIRFSCEDNEDIINYINNLQPQGIENLKNDEEMKKLGLKFDIDPLKGKFRIIQEKK